MRRHILFVLFPIVVVLLAGVPLASAQPALRVPPPNDNFANAITIIPGTSASVTDIENATVEGGQPGVSACGSAIAINHSVWYRVDMPITATIHLSTEGTLLVTGKVESHDTVVALFTGESLGTLSQVACNDDSHSPFSELTFTAIPGTIYYVLVGTASSEPFDASSVLKFNTRVKYTAFIPGNYSFEFPFSPTDWTLSNGTGDGRICNNLTYPATIGICAFRFVGGPEEASKLKQSFPVSPYFVPRKNGLLAFHTDYRVLDSPIGTAKIKYKVSYTDGTPASSKTVNLTGEPVGSYTLIKKMIYLTSKNVGNLTVLIKFKSTTGTLLVDNVLLMYTATSSVRSDAKLLGVPEPPK